MGLSLAGVCVMLHQTPDRRRDVDFTIRDMQLDMHHPKQDVVLKSIKAPFLQTRMQRDDVRMLDVHLRHVELVLGDLEVSVTGAAWEQARLLKRNLVPDAAGLAFAEVISRATVPYQLSRKEPPLASSKNVVSKLV